MIKAPKLYLKRKDIPIQSLYDMRDEEAVEVQAGTYHTKTKSSEINHEFRSTTLKKVSPEDYPDINKILLNMINVWDGTKDPNDYFVGEYNYLKYGKDDHFIKHRDFIGVSKNGGRVYSTSTIIHKSDDLKGGRFIMYDDNNFPHHVELDIGETVFFSSHTNHMIEKVIEGEREVLVAWIYKKEGWQHINNSL